MAGIGNMVERSFDKSLVKTFSLQTVTTKRRATGAPYTSTCWNRNQVFFLN